MKLIYVAGPYTANTVWQVKQNILNAERAGAQLIAGSQGLFPVIPHKNTEFMEGLRDGQYFIDGTKELMRRCDAVFVVPFAPHHDSVGTVGEVNEAERLGIPVFYCFEDVYDWVENQEVKPTILQKMRKFFHKQELRLGIHNGY